MSFMSFDISSIFCCFSSSSSFSKFCSMVLAFSREALAFAMCVELGPVVVLTLLMSLITSLCDVEFRCVLFWIVELLEILDPSKIVLGRHKFADHLDLWANRWELSFH